MCGDLELFLDTSVLFAAVHSEKGGARMILKLGEAGTVSLWVGPWVLREAEAVLAGKSPKRKAHFVLLIDRAGIRVGEEAGANMLERAFAVVDYQPDAEVLAEVLVIGADYFVSMDRKHLVGNPRAGQLAFPIGTPGDFLEWYREWLMKRG